MNKRTIYFWLFVLAVTSPCQAELVTYPGPPGMAESEHYEVAVTQNGNTQRSFVYITRAKWRSNRSKDTSWTTFSFSGRVTVKVTKLTGSFKSCKVLPSSYGIKPSIAGNSATFDLDRPRKVSVEFDDPISHPLLIFADAPEQDVPDAKDPKVIFFGPGRHEVGENFTIGAGKTVYIAGGAYVKGKLTSNDAKRITIRGRGILSGEDYPRGGSHLIDLKGWKTSDALIEGITLVDSPKYNIVMAGARNTVRNVKMISWYFSTDGVGSGPDAVVEDCFFKVNDDAVKLYFSRMRVRDCVFWQMENGAPFQISWNMPSNQSDFVVSNCDVIRLEHKWNNDNEAVFDSIHGGSGHMSGYLFENIRIENADWRLMSLRIKPNEFADPAGGLGQISNITLRNITVTGVLSQPSVIQGHDARHRIVNVTFENLRINGKLITGAADGNFVVDPGTTSNIRFLVAGMN